MKKRREKKKEKKHSFGILYPNWINLVCLRKVCNRCKTRLFVLGQIASYKVSWDKILFQVLHLEHHFVPEFVDVLDMS